MQIGMDSFAAAIGDPATGVAPSPVQRIENLRNQRELPIAELSGSSVALEAPEDYELVGNGGDGDQ